jgi:transcriptional regulator with XRE-family HTH domain
VKTVQESFGEQVRRLRKARGWSQEELGARTERHWTYIGGIERGERNPTLRVIADLAKAFGLPMRDLFPNKTDC